MGWQDDQVVQPAAQGAQQSAPAWASDPVVTPPQAAQQPAAPEQPAQPQQANTWGNAIKNVGEAAANFATGMVGGFAGDVAGLGATAYDITANAVMHPLSGADPGGYADPAAVREKVANAL